MARSSCPFGARPFRSRGWRRRASRCARPRRRSSCVWALARSAAVRLPPSRRRALLVGGPRLRRGPRGGRRDRPARQSALSRRGPTSASSRRSSRRRSGSPGSARRGLPRGRGRTAVVAVAAFAGAAGLLLRASASEPARKQDVARAALAGPTLDVVRALFDFDGDGYAGWFNGGDCDDHDPEVHPGAIDHPGDGFDDDCDGQDAAAGLPPAAVMAPVPAAVPANLNLVFITIDTLGAAHLGCYGYARPTSPRRSIASRQRARSSRNCRAHAPDDAQPRSPRSPSGRWLPVFDRLGRESIWWPRMATRRPHARRGAARRRLLHGGHLHLQLLRRRRPARVRAGHG